MARNEEKDTGCFRWWECLMVLSLCEEEVGVTNGEGGKKGSTWEIVCGVSTEKSRSLIKTLGMVESNGG